MTESKEKSPAAEKDAEKKKPAAKKRTATKAVAAKPRAKKAAKKDTEPTLALEEATPAAKPVKAEVPAPAPVAVATPAPEPAPVPAAIPAPVPIAPQTDVAPVQRSRPVYIPRDIAKQLESMGIAQDSPEALAHMQEINAQNQAKAAAAAQQAREAREARGDTRGESGRGDGRGDGRGRGDQHHHHHRGPAPVQAEPAPQEIEVEEQPSEPPTGELLGVSEGIVEVSGKGFGFIRDAGRMFAQNPGDVFVTPEICRAFNMRDGQWVKGETRRGNRGAQIYRVLEINGEEPDKSRVLPAFDELTVISPMEKFKLETTADRYTTRIIDMMCPIGKGQRGLIVAPPRTGKTTFLHHIADGIVANHPEVHLMLLLVDERPEEVTEFKRTIPKAEIMASSNDSDVKSHTRIAMLAAERARRLTEQGRDVFILLDSITRVGRAFNNATAGGGRTGSGGLDNRALEIPRKIFASARNTEEAGSLTIVATALIDTNSAMDERIFQEFKGTGNMELVLDRKISDMRIYPAVDIYQSGTRREELLIPADDLHKIGVIRRGLSGGKPIDAMERLLFFMKKFPTNAEMLKSIPG